MRDPDQVDDPADALDLAVLAHDCAGYLRRARKLLGWTQEKLAARLGKPQPRISEWERGEKRPSDETRQVIDELAQEVRGE